MIIVVSCSIFETIKNQKSRICTKIAGDKQKMDPYTSALQSYILKYVVPYKDVNYDSSLKDF